MAKYLNEPYRSVEAIIIAGILLGVIGLFQGWKLFAYEIGFFGPVGFADGVYGMEPPGPHACTPESQTSHP